MTVRVLILAALAVMAPVGGIVAQSGGSSGAKAALASPDMPDGEKSSADAAMTGRRSDLIGGRRDFSKMFREVEKRRLELDRREREVELAEKRLKALKAEIEEKTDALVAARRRLEDAYGKSDALRLKRLKAMAPAYEAMQPTAAAEILAGLDNPNALSMLELMESKKVAKILDAMALSSAERAIELTKELHKIVPGS